MIDHIVIGNKRFDLTKRTYVMGILNVTPDSFSDGGKYARLESALAQTERMIAEGADLIDVGGESTRPGHTKISAEEEIERVLPYLRAIKSRFDIPISLDTYKGEVAEAGIAEGADLINDIMGLKGDYKMPEAIVRHGVPVCVMHNCTKGGEYADLMADIVRELDESLTIARRYGIDRSRIIVDPGIGFAKDANQNLTVLHRLAELKRLDCPILLGVSRKSVIGHTLNLPIDQRLEGTMAASVLAVVDGVSFVRVHDVGANVRAIRMTEAIMREKI